MKENKVFRRPSNMAYEEVVANGERFNYWKATSQDEKQCLALGISCAEASYLALYFEGRYSQAIDFNIRLEQERRRK